MKRKKLIELLTMLDGVSTSNYQTMQAVHKVLGQSKILSKEWGDKHKNNYLDFYPLDLINFDNWCTFNNNQCLDLRFYIDKNSLHCKAIIYDGDSFNGRRTGKRFEVHIVLPASFIDVIKDNILYNFDLFLEEKYEQHLLVQKLMFIANLKMKYLEI